MLRFVSKDYRRDTTAAAASLQLVAALALVPILRLEHRHAIRSSAFIALYLSLAMLLDGTESRSFFIRNFPRLGGLAAALGATRLTILVLEEIPKLHLLLDPEIRRASQG